MSDVAVGALIGVVGTLAAVVLTQLGLELRAHRASDRERQQRVAALLAEWNLRALRDARRLAEAELHEWLALAAGRTDEYNTWARERHRYRDGNLRLIGDVNLVRRYHDAVVDLRGKYGKGVYPEDLAALASLENDLAAAFDRQEERVLRDQEPLRVAVGEAPELFDATAITERLRLPDQPAPLAARLAAWMVERRVAQAVRRRARGDTGSSGS